VAAYAGRLYEALTCPKALLRFTAAEGAGDHCEASARSVNFQRCDPARCDDHGGRIHPDVLRIWPQRGLSSVASIWGVLAADWKELT
jgi:hypothetical protein